MQVSRQAEWRKMRAGRKTRDVISNNVSFKEGESRCSGNGPVNFRSKSLTSHKLDVTSVTTLVRTDKADSLGRHGRHTYR